MNRLKEAMLLLIANDGPLGAEWLDHPLKSEWAGHRECHIGGDFLLAYKVDESDKTGLIVFVRAGTHAELLNEYAAGADVCVCRRGNAIMERGAFSELTTFDNRRDRPES